MQLQFEIDKNKMKVILASGSPRRREILSTAKIPFEVIVSNEEEHILNTIPSQVVEELSLIKAESVAKKLSDNTKYLVIGADTVVVHKNRILGKPLDESEAYNMLKELSDDVHEVYTGVTLIVCQNGKIITKRTFNSVTRVYVDKLNKEDIDAYIATKDSFDKAGGYAIQGMFGQYINKIEGEYNNVVGLPISAIRKEIEKI